MADGNDSRLKVLVLGADQQSAAELSHRIEFLEYDPVIAESSEITITDQHFAAVVVHAGGNDKVARAASELRSEHPVLPFLCVEDGVATDNGPNWTLALPLKRSQLERLLNRAKRYQGVERRHRLTGTSRSIGTVRGLIEHVAEFDTNVMITGESGTGKELVARAIHELSNRSDKPFVPINCGAIPADLIESELFGHEKGAFTGAISSRTGRFELAEGGTLFLDEIGDMSLPMQVKLLRVLQERTFERVGSGKTQHCDVRIVAATHRNLPAAVRAGEFREDLFYRLNVFPIEMPPLFKRVSDLPLLLNEFLVAHRGERKGELRVSPGAIQVLANYRWPGNIRELSNLVERLAIVKPEGIIDVDDLPAKYREATPQKGSATNDVVDAMQLTNASLKDHLQSVEQDLIRQAIKASDGVVARAARLLKMRRTTLVEKIGKYNLA